MSTPESAEAGADANATTAGNGTPDPAEPKRPTADGTPADAPAAADDTTAEAPDPGGAGGTDSPSGTATAPGSKADLLPSPIFLLLLGITGLAGWLSWNRAELAWGGDEATVYLPFVFILGGWIVSIALHEFAHAVLAYRFGDRALRGSGYLRLNPFRFRELFAGLLLPVAFPILGGIGMTGPAGYLDRAAVPGKGGRTLIALAGPAANLLLAALLAAVISALMEPDAVTNNWALGGLMYLCYLNLAAALINLLPVPGLDGFGALAPYLPERLARHTHTSGLFGVIAVFAVLWFPPVNLAFINLMFGVFGLLGLTQVDIGYGLVLFQFWGV